VHADLDSDNPGDDSAYQHAGAYTDPDSDGHGHAAHNYPAYGTTAHSYPVYGAAVEADETAVASDTEAAYVYCTTTIGIPNGGRTRSSNFPAIITTAANGVESVYAGVATLPNVHSL
jgi:hypothetical protein